MHYKNKKQDFRLSRFPKIWAIAPSALVQLESVVQSIDTQTVETFINSEPIVQDPNFVIDGNTAILKIDGAIQPKQDIFSFLLGSTTIDVLTRDFNTLLEDNDVEHIILDIDSPGGVAFTIQEFANLVFNSRGIKKISAISSTEMLSAAYWIGAACENIYIVDEVVATGSIGVVTSHVDVSELEKMAGIKVTEITAGKKKRVAGNHAPLSSEGRLELESQVNHIYSVFTSDVAKFRGVNQETVLNSMADGQVFIGSMAIKAGLVDEVKSLKDVIASTSGSEQKAKTVPAPKVVSVPKPAPKVEAVKTVINPLPVSEAVKTESSAIPAGFRSQASHDAYHQAIASGAAGKPRTYSRGINPTIEPGTISPKVSNLEKQVSENKFLENENLSSVDALQAEYEASAELQQKFSSAGSYIAFTQAQEAGRVRIFDPKVRMR